MFQAPCVKVRTVPVLRLSLGKMSYFCRRFRRVARVELSLVRYSAGSRYLSRLSYCLSPRIACVLAIRLSRHATKPSIAAPNDPVSANMKRSHPSNGLSKKVSGLKAINTGTKKENRVAPGDPLLKSQTMNRWRRVISGILHLCL